MSEFDDESVIPLQAHHAAHDHTKVFERQQFEWFLLRYAEVGLMAEKGRQRMEKALRKHLLYHAKQMELSLKRIEIEFGRLIVQLPDTSQKNIQKLIEISQKVFGIVSISPAIRIEKDLNRISESCAKYTSKFLNMGEKVAVKVKGEQNQFRREDVAKKCHESILQTAPKDVTINLHEPDLRIFVEIRKLGAFIYSAIIPTAWGGLPTDKENGLVAQFSGNPTEIVAAIRMMRRGCNIFPVIFRSAVNDKFTDYWDRVDHLLNFLPFPRVYGIEFNLDSIHKRVAKKMIRYWDELDDEWKKQIDKGSISTNISIEAIHQGIFCLFCWKIRFTILERILKGQKDFYASCLGSEGELIMESNLFLDDRWDEHPVGPKKVVFTPNLPNSDLMNKMELFRVRFKAQLTGLHENTKCPFDPILFSFITGYEFPGFHAAYVLEPENILFEFNTISPYAKPSSDDEVNGSKNKIVCSHFPSHISFPYQKQENQMNLGIFYEMFKKCSEKMNLENLVNNILPEGQILVLKDEASPTF